MNDAFICDAVRTPFGRYGGALANAFKNSKTRFCIASFTSAANLARSTGSSSSDVFKVTARSTMAEAFNGTVASMSIFAN